VKVTFVGVALTSDGHLHGRSFTCAADDLRPTHPARLSLNFAHERDWVLGQVISLYRVRSGDVWAVASGDDVEPWILDGPCYFSPEFTARPDGTDIELTGLAIATVPATVGLRSKGPLAVFPGDPGDAGAWLIGGKVPAGVVGDVIRESRQEWRRRYSRSAMCVGGYDPDAGPWVEGEPLRLRDERPSGKLRRSGSQGRILRVS
jgi:hypothetical protein